MFERLDLVEAGPTNPAVRSSDLFTPVLKRLLDLSHELVGDGTVNQTVIVTEGQVHQGADRNGVVAIFVRNHNRRLGDSAHAHDGRIGLVDNGKPEDGA